jgi:uncharacterized protein DUF2637/winged helix-turn-helix DNA-binding protein
VTKTDKPRTALRWAVRATVVLGVAASVAANVLHAEGDVISQIISAWPPLALLITVEIVPRVPIAARWWSVLRILATVVIAAIAAWVSYWHMVGVALRYGETWDAAHLLPLSVDGLIAVASVCLIELGKTRSTTTDTAPVAETDTPAAGDGTAPRPVFDHDEPIGPETAGTKSNRVRVVNAHQWNPTATNSELAEQLGVSLKTVERYRPARQINGATR